MNDFYFPLPKKKNKSVNDCTTCKRKKENNFNERLYFKGINYNGLVILADSVHESEIQNGELLPFKEVFKGKTYNGEKNDCYLELKSVAAKNRIYILKHCGVAYALNCTSKKEAKDKQYSCCREQMKKALKALNPKMIICLGENAFKSLFELNEKQPKLRIRGNLIPNYIYNCVVYTTLNPIDSISGNYKYAIRKDLESAFNLWKNHFHNRKEVDNFLNDRKILNNIDYKVIKTEKEYYIAIKQISKLEEVAFDYETTNTKPHDIMFEITHSSFGTKDYAWIFRTDFFDNKIELYETHFKPWMKWFFETTKIKKVIQNEKFEEMVSVFEFNIDKINNSFCTMLAQHVLNEKSGCTGLDYQNLIRFGIPPYSDTVKSFLIKKTKDDFKNNIYKAPQEDLDLYAALDVITTYNNYLEIQRLMRNKTQYPTVHKNYNLLYEGHKTFSKYSQRGATIDINNFEKLKILLDDTLENLINQIRSLPEVIEFNSIIEERNGTKKKTKGKQTLKELIEK